MDKKDEKKIAYFACRSLGSMANIGGFSAVLELSGVSGRGYGHYCWMNVQGEAQVIRLSA